MGFLGPCISGKGAFEWLHLRRDATAWRLPPPRGCKAAARCEMRDARCRAAGQAMPVGDDELGAG